MADPIISAIARGAEFRIDSIRPGASDKAAEGAGGAGGFGDMLSSSLRKLDGLQQDADTQSNALATGQAKDITEVVMAVERASLSLQLASQVRNKAVDAYHEIFRMPI